jgi:hypothetical protein
MKLAWGAQRTKPALLTAVAVLQKRVKSPTEQDEAHLRTVLRYVRGTLNDGLIFNKSDDNKLEMWVDANHSVYSRTGVVIKWRGCTIMCRSIQQKIVTRSSCESEIVALDDGASLLLWIRRIIDTMKISQKRSVINEDNQATIRLIMNGQSNAERTRHINIKYFWLHQEMKTGEILLRYVNTEYNLADYFTKCLTNAVLFERFVRHICGV